MIRHAKGKARRSQSGRRSIAYGGLQHSQPKDRKFVTTHSARLSLPPSWNGSFRQNAVHIFGGSLFVWNRDVFPAMRSCFVNSRGMQSCTARSLQPPMLGCQALHRVLILTWISLLASLTSPSHLDHESGHHTKPSDQGDCSTKMHQRYTPNKPTGRHRERRNQGGCKDHSTLK